MSLDRPTFMSRDYGDRTIPAEAEVASQGDEEDVTVWTWRDDEMVYLQQGYDLIVIPLEAIEKLAGARREGALRDAAAYWRNLATLAAAVIESGGATQYQAALNAWRTLSASPAPR